MDRVGFKVSVDGRRWWLKVVERVMQNEARQVVEEKPDISNKNCPLQKIQKGLAELQVESLCS